MIKKIIAVNLTILVLLISLFSCAGDDSEEVLRYGDAAISERMFMYELSYYKTQMMSDLGITEANFNNLMSIEITDSTGGANTSHYTWGDLMYQECLANLRIKLFFADYALKNGGELTDEQKSAIDTQLDDVVAQLGSKGAVNKYLEKYGINYSMYREWLEMYQLYANGLTLAYSDGGGRAISFEEAYEFYQENYITVKHIAIGTEIAGTDENGNTVYFDDEEKEERRKVIDTVREQIEGGVDFDELYKESEDGQAELYPDGYTITQGAMDDEMKGYEETALSLEIGEVGEWENEGYGYYFIKRVELLKSDFYNCQSVFLPDLIELDKARAITENSESFEEKNDIINSYNLLAVSALS